MRNNASHEKRIVVCLELVRREAKQVCVAGSFNDWRPADAPMLALGGGWWVKELALSPGRYEYCLVVDGRWMPEPNESKTNIADGRVNSVLVVSGEAAA